MSKFIGRFVEEARDHINNLNKGLMALEKNPGDSETINSIFRSAHTVKGSSRMLKLTAISELAHKVEDALGALRDGRVEISPEMSDVLFKGLDAIAAMVEKAAAGEKLDEDNSELIKVLEEVAAGNLSSSSLTRLSGAARKPEVDESDTPTPEATGPVQTAGTSQKPLEKKEGARAQNLVEETVRINTEKLSELIRLASEITSSHSRLKQRYNEVNDLSKLSAELAGRISSNGGNGSQDHEDLMGSAESVAMALRKVSSSFNDDLSLHELLMRDLQERTLKMRMLPLSTIFDTFHRTVREISSAHGKSIELTIEGSETEMDKKIIEKIGDPIMHMFRNAIDHGIEDPDERKVAGKSPKGSIRLSAVYEGGNVLIVMSDDGRGISAEKIKQKALQKGLMTEDSIAAMSRAEALNLIFMPGFSTSPIITDVSGRGVGMDVVKKNIVEDLKGSINIETEEGRGTAFYMRLPMTLAIMPIMLAEASGVTLAFPDNYVSEIIKVKGSDIIDVLDKKAVNIREQLVPVEDLNALLGLPERKALSHEDLLLMVIRVGAERLGLVVDSIIDKEDMVIKSLPVHMKNIKMVSGVIITGKNQVVNVLNVPSIMLAAKEAKGTLMRRDTAQAAKRTVNVLVVDDSINTREIEKSILEAYGYNVTMAGDGAEALDKALDFSYDVVITDVEMPIMDGFTLTQRLREDMAYRDTPIILLTSRDKDEDKRRGIQVGANAYIVKGDFEQSNLIETIQNLVI
jgi:chemotaxis protein histidine kinase CheA